MNTTLTPPSWNDPPPAAAHPAWAATAVLTICLLAVSAAAIRVNLHNEPLAKPATSGKLGQEKSDKKPAIAGMESAQRAIK